MREPTLTQIAKRCRISWRAWAQVDDENKDGEGLPDDMTREWVDQHIQLCDAVIEGEIRREELEWLREFERVVRNEFDKLNANGLLVMEAQLSRAIESLDQQRADREGPQT